MLIPVAWWAVMKIYPPELTSLAGMEQLCEDYECIGPLGRREKLYIALLAVNLLLWCTTSIHGLSQPDSGRSRQHALRLARSFSYPLGKGQA
ncbi:hypothetical protein [uncultured Mailhella sp.]|uniref:hypothetical protein n=1 Tax=uncultured Mailhella sp. TaxID=1981031 RepID=UPI003208BDB7